MTDSQFKEIKQSNPWNPLEPTCRDIERTEELANKNPIIAGILTFLLLPAAMIYLNRGVNSLKIFAYAMCIALPLTAAIAESEEQAFGIGQSIGYLANIVMIVENVGAINKAKKRKV